jgi:hypothetical protein
MSFSSKECVYLRRRFCLATWLRRFFGRWIAYDKLKSKAGLNRKQEQLSRTYERYGPLKHSPVPMSAMAP